MNGTCAGLKVVSPGLLSTLQDKGRFGLRHLGIPWAGALCPAWQTISNALVGNPTDATVIECFEGGLQLQACEQPVTVAIVGSETAKVKSVSSTGHEQRCRANRTYTLTTGDSLYLSSTGSSRHAIIAIAGIAVSEHLGSTSTYAKASLGGLNGNKLSTGDKISITPLSSSNSTMHTEQQCQLPKELQFEAAELRAIPGPQFDHFSTQGVESFVGSCYELGSEADRMGVRLHGPTIAHRDSGAKDIVSDAILPGSIQVPGTGQPIVMLNDAHTAGGYPKIATVISTDLPLLGIQRSGARFRFRLVGIDEAVEIRRHMNQLIEKCISAFTPCIRTEIDTQTLMSCNLIDGVTDGL